MEQKRMYPGWIKLVTDAPAEAEDPELAAMQMRENEVLMLVDCPFYEAHTGERHKGKLIPGGGLCHKGWQDDLRWLQCKGRKGKCPLMRGK